TNYYLGYAYFKNNDFPEACRQLEKFLAAFYDSTYTDKAIYLLADSFYNRKMLEEAIDNFEKILKDFSHNKDLAEKAEYSIAYALYEQGEQVEAVKKIRQFIDGHQDSQLTKRLMFWLGQYYYDNSLYELARRTFDAAIANYSQDKRLIGEAKYEIGLSYLAEGKTGDALSVFEKLSQETDTVLLKMKSTLAMADLLSGQDKKKEAIGMYSSVVSFASADATAKSKDNTGIEFDGFLDYTKGEIQLPKSVVFDSPKNRDSDSAEKLVKIAYIRLGDLYREDREFDNAVYSYKQAMKFMVQESNAYLQFRIGECLEEKDDLAASVEEYLKVPYFKEEDKFWVVKGLFRCAHIYEDKEDWRRAITMYERALNYDTPEVKYAQERIDSIKTQIGKKNCNTEALRSHRSAENVSVIQ
ncbi:MAG: tetratricopeptide repeat protein, partial [Candidatus Omnitrophica bacterium]|nr:tetratricopeptide repeat protein [Candidatus Omnitrophota bacterium]